MLLAFMARQLVSKELWLGHPQNAGRLALFRSDCWLSVPLTNRRAAISQFCDGQGT